MTVQLRSPRISSRLRAADCRCDGCRNRLVRKSLGLWSELGVWMNRKVLVRTGASARGAARTPSAAVTGQEVSEICNPATPQRLVLLMSNNLLVPSVVATGVPHRTAALSRLSYTGKATRLQARNRTGGRGCPTQDSYWEARPTQDKQGAAVLHRTEAETRLSYTGQSGSIP